MRTNIDNIQGKKILVVGLGRSGISACQTMVDMGAIVTVQDTRKESEFDKNFLTYLRGKEITCYS